MTKDATELKNNAKDDIWLAGVDGCRDKWVAAFVRPTGFELNVRVFNDFAGIMCSPERPAIVAVDMPIGLAERAGIGGRDAENAIRPLLETLRQSVFSIPSRHAVYAELGPFADRASRHAAHQRACAIAEATSQPPRRITIQAFGIFPKIREIDRLLRDDETIRSKVHEAHPEMAFWQMNDQCGLLETKKSKEGSGIRRRLLVQAGLPESVTELRPPKGARPDDLLDALACAVTARRIHAGLARSYPQSAPRDAYGLPMAIWA
jgi:predicted RNase H-like nuclease